MADSTTNPQAEPGPSHRAEPPPTGAVIDHRTKPWVWSVAQILFVCATIGHIAYDAIATGYTGERITIGLGFMTLVVLGVNVDRLLGRGGGK